MSPETIGILFGLATAVCWCFSSLAFEEAGKRAGSVPVNVLRLLVAFAFLTIASTLTRGLPLPTDASPHQWKWLLLSGVVGFFIGDVTLFRALVLIGARLTSLITCTAPIFALIAERLILQKSHGSLWQYAGVMVTIAGVAWVVSERAKAATPSTYKVTWKGLTLAILGAAGQGVGAVLTSRALEAGPYDAFATNQVRMIAGIALFVVFVIATARLRDVYATLHKPAAMAFLTLGAFGGPFLGVTLFIKSLKYVSPSVTQTMVSLVPIMMIPIVIALGREKITPRALAGTLIAVAGVYLLVISARA